MKIKTLEIENFRGIKKLQMDLHPQLTILLGENATGKTSVLDAVAIGVGSYFAGLEGKGVKAPTIDKDDIRQTKRAPVGDERITSISAERHVPTRLLLGVEWGAVEQIARTKQQYDGRTDWAEINNVKGMARQHMKAIRAGGAIQLPLITMIPASPRTRRATRTPPKLSSEGAQSSRVDGYRAALEANMDSDTLLNWWIWTEMRRANGLPGFQEILEAFHKILVKIVPDVEALDFDAIDGQPEFLFRWGSSKFSWLSSGQERVVLMVADLFFRAMTLNPQLGASVADEIEGVVLIDETDQSLHPSWQRTVLSGLCASFPKVQFIVTTHGEQVLAGIAGRDEEPMVRRMSRGEDGEIEVRRLKVPAGLDADALLLGDWFALSTTLDAETERLMHEHAALSLKAQQRRFARVEVAALSHAGASVEGDEGRLERLEAQLMERMGRIPTTTTQPAPDLRAQRLARLRDDQR